MGTAAAGRHGPRRFAVGVLAVAAAAVVLAAGCGGVAGDRRTATQPPLRRVLLGDSITFGIPPDLGGYGELVPGAVVVGGPGQDPAHFPWEAQLRETGASDVIVLQDHVVDGEWYAVYGPAWEAAWRRLVAAAHRQAPRVYILVGGGGASVLSTMPGIHITMPPPDHPDGVHYTAEGSRALALMVERLAV